MVILMSKYSETKKKPFFYKVLRRIVTLFLKRREFLGKDNMPSEPSIYVGNHAQMYGPLVSEAYFPGKKYIWCIGQMMKMKEVPAYAYEDFWHLKPKWIKWFFKIVSYLIAPIASYVLSRADTIAVYKDARLMATYRDSMDKLNEGANIVIFPECQKEFNNIVNEFQDKFIDVARLYYRKTGKKVKFVPMYNAVKLRKVVFGKPIEYNPDIDINEQRKIICDYLKEEITRIAQELPTHKVVPYNNVSSKHYPMSK